MTRSARRSRGFTLISVLTALVVAGLGVLVLGRVMGAATGAATQNSTITSLASLGNGFWGAVQANPTLLTAAGFVGTYTSANQGSAPALLQPWLGQALATLPEGEVVIATGADAGSGGACSATAGCTVTLSMSWQQVAAQGLAGMRRAHTLYFQFGL